MTLFSGTNVDTRVPDGGDIACYTETFHVAFGEGLNAYRIERDSHDAFRYHDQEIWGQ